ncbi:DNA-binding protein HEXBP, partial [Nephila pilipes]
MCVCEQLLLQKTWELKLNWKADVDSGTKDEFLKWMRDIFLLEKVRIPRLVKRMRNILCIFFSDASMYANVAVAFLRVETSECVKVQLLCAKSRVSPTGKKKTTIAGLELLLTTITARLASSINREIPHEKIYFWRDSTTVITWIKREDAYGTFVQNRVSEIETLTSKVNWRRAWFVKPCRSLKKRLFCEEIDTVLK